jgi:hypothetical protein
MIVVAGAGMAILIALAVAIGRLQAQEAERLWGLASYPHRRDGLTTCPHGT